MFDAIREWFLSLGAAYGVNPLIFGAIYVGAIPFFTASVAWLVRNARRGQRVAVPALAAGFFFVSAYLYLIVAGKNVPWWVYGLVAVLVAGGAWSTVRSVRQKVATARAEGGRYPSPSRARSASPPAAVAGPARTGPRGTGRR